MNNNVNLDTDYGQVSNDEKIMITKNLGLNHPIVSEDKHRKFVLKCMIHFSKLSIWTNIDSYIKDALNEGSPVKVEGQSFRLTGLFLCASREELEKRNKKHPRWYDHPFKIKGKTVYLSMEWEYPENNKKNSNLNINTLTYFIPECFGSNYEVVNNGTNWELWEHSTDSVTPFESHIKTSCDSDNIPEGIELVPFSISGIISMINETGLLYDPILVKRFAFSLMSKRFLILSGLAGSGKTQLAIAFASALIEDKSQMCVVSVGADWTNREPLLGFPNALQEGHYVIPESGVLDLLIEANKPENAEKPFFLILDEMNMSYVERYFADFLSVMESGVKIRLWKGSKESEVPNELALPQNLFIIGTINVDETTYMFSPKVLDRANVIEFKISQEEMAIFLDEMKPIDRKSINHKAAGMAASFVQLAAKEELADDKEMKKTLLSFFSSLKSVNAEFGYRSVTEMYRFIYQAQHNDDSTQRFSDEQILDCVIVQKLLPKLHGSRKKLEPVLLTLWNECFDKEAQKENLTISIDNIRKAKFPLTADKLQRMYEAAYANGFTSFAEA